MIIRIFTETLSITFIYKNVSKFLFYIWVRVAMTKDVVETFTFGVAFLSKFYFFFTFFSMFQKVLDISRYKSRPCLGHSISYALG